MSKFAKSALGVAAAGMIVGGMFAVSTPADAKDINIRIASGHPPTVVYAG